MKAKFVIRATTGKTRKGDPSATKRQKCFTGEIECPDGSPSLPEFAVSTLTRVTEDHPDLHQCEKLEMTIAISRS